MFISNGSYEYEDPPLKNVIAFLVQYTHRPLRAFQLPGFNQGRIGPTMEIWDNSVPDIPILPCLHYGNVYIKRKLRVCRA